LSIDKVRKLTESRGCCGIATIIGMAMDALFFIVPSTCGKSLTQLGQDMKNSAPAETVIAKIGDFSITSESVMNSVKAKETGPTEPMQDAQIIGQVLQEFVSNGVVYNLAATKGVKFSDADILKEINQELDTQLMIAKINLMQNGQLKPNATDADFETAFKAQEGMDTKAWRQKSLDLFTPKLADPIARPSLAAGIARQGLEAQASLSINPTDDELKRQNDVLTFKRIYIRPLPGAPTPADTAKKALEDVKGGLSFEDAMNRYSNDAPSGPGKPLSSSTLTLGVGMLSADPAKKSLLKVKAGELSDVLSVEGGAAIYKLISEKTTPIPDFEKNKANLKKSYTQQFARPIVDAEVADATKSIKIDWKSPAFKALYDLTKASTIASGDSKKKLEEIEKTAKSASGSSDEERAGILARYTASTLLWAQYTPAEKKAAHDDRIETLNALLTDTESIGVRLELADLYAENKDAKHAVEQLQNAAGDNNDLTRAGQDNYGTITAKLAKYKSQGLVKPEDEKSIQDQLDLWKNDMTEKVKADEDRKKADAEDRKRAAEEKKKLDEAAKKAPAPKASPKKPG